MRARSSNRPGEPTMAELSRTMLARSRVGTLMTAGTAGAKPAATVVALLGDPRGRPVVWLDPASPALAEVIARPTVSVRLSPDRLGVLVIEGNAAQLPADKQGGQVPIRLEPSSVHVILGTRHNVELTAYTRARPDPLRRDAPRILAHLRHAHASDLLACLRAQISSDIEWAEPTGLDRHGLQLAILTGQGTGIVRLPFPRPVATLDELGAGLAAALRCQCRADDPPTP